MAATSLSFLPSALAAGCLQPTQFMFPLQKLNPTLPQLLLPIPMPCRRSPVPVSFSSYRALYLYLPLVMYISFTCFQMVLLFAGRVLRVSGPGASSPCLCVFPYAHACKFFPLFCSRLSLSCDTSLQTRTRAEISVAANQQLQRRSRKLTLNVRSPHVGFV